MNKKQAAAINAGLTSTTKMPCKSYSLPTVACITGFRMSQIAGSICANCYAQKGNYHRYAGNIEPTQHARLVSLDNPLWIASMVVSIGDDDFFRWHDSGDLQSVRHLELIAEVARQTPGCKHWLPTREYGIVAEFIRKNGALPENLIIRLSAMFPDVPVKIPASLQGIANITASNVHSKKPLGTECRAPKNNGKCGDCRLCWNSQIVVSYLIH